MNVVNDTNVIVVLVLIVGLVAGILLRRRDGRAALLVALGFGLEILASVLSFVFVFVREAIDHGAGSSGSVTIAFLFGLVVRLMGLAAYALIFWGLLRLVRRRATAGAGVAR